MLLPGTLMRDVRYALRTARRNPGSTLAAFLGLTLGIGATTAIFSVVNAVILRPLPLKDEHSVVRIFSSDSRSDKDFVSMADFLDWKKQLKSFSGLALYRFDQANLTGQGVPERVRILECDSALLPVAGVTVIRGRNFYPGEDRPGQDSVALLSWAFWQNHFGGQNVIGRKIILDGAPYTAIGVLPRDFVVFGERDIWVPIAFDLTLLPDMRGQRWYWAVGRLRRGVSLAQANAELTTEAGSLASAYPKQNKGVGARAIIVRDSIDGKLRPALLMLLGGGLCVLLIACGNVANLALTRASRRQREISIRIALGASRATLLRQLFTENILLSLCAAAAALGLAAAAIRILRSFPGNRIPHPEEINLDWRVLLFAIAIGVMTGVGFGLAPAIQTSMIRVHDAIKQSSGRLTESRGQQRLRSFFVFSETAVAALLLIQSGLLIKSYAKASQIDPGFDADHVLALHISLTTARYGLQHPGSIDLFSGTALAAIRRLPGVENAAITTDLPLIGTGGGGGILAEGEAVRKNLPELPYVQWTSISPDYFRTMRIHRIAGRGFDNRDRSGGRDVVIVNQALVARFFHGQNPIGRRIAITAERPEWREIVGVVENVPQLEIERKALPEIFFPLAQFEFPWLAIVVRTSADPLSYTNAIRREVEKVDPGVAVFLPRTMQHIIGAQLGWRVFQTSLVGVFGAIAIVLASIGIYAVVAYSVTQRVSEIGIRMALGAEKQDILRAVVRKGAMPAFLGSLVGALCSLAISKSLSQLLYGIQSADMSTYLLVIVFFFAVAMVASYVPARRAAALDPSRALRYE